jgi:hypothetical protein
MQIPALKKVDKLGPLLIPLHGLHAMALSYGENQFKQTGECKPMFVLAVGTDVLWLEEGWRSSDERGFKLRRMREIISAVDARAYTFISEVYVTTARSGDEMDRKSARSLAYLSKEERDEMLWVDSWHRDGTHFVSQYLITPRRSGLNFLGPRQDVSFDEPGDKFVGRAANLFEPPTAARP